MKRLAIFVPDNTDSTSFYRAVLPYSRLRKQCNIELTFIRDVTWASLSNVDICLFQRPCTYDHIKMIKIAKRLGKPIITEHDDDLMTIPLDNPCSEYYNKPNIQEAIKLSLQMADVVTTASDNLKEKFLKYNKNVFTIENALDDDIAKAVKKEKTGPNKIILWRGSSTHMKDVYTYKEEIITAMKCNPDWTLLFMGMTPWFVMEELPTNQVKVLEMMDVLEYFELICKIQPDILMVPLHFNEFNMSKSNIAWIEGTLAGAACLVPDMPNWKKLSRSYYYSNTHEFGKSLRYMMNEYNYPFLQESNKESWEYIQENLLLSVVNKKRKEIINKL